MPQEQIPLVKKFDRDGDGRLNAEERKAAREYLQKERETGWPRRGPGGPPGRRSLGASAEVRKAGPGMSPQDARAFPDAPLYASNVVRTLFLTFDASDWEKELADFHGTDVEVPARLNVDGQEYPDVGVHFRGTSSYFMIGEGSKRSLNLSLDFAHPHQRLGGYRTLDLLNSHEDPSFLRTVLYLQIAREYLAAPQANFVRVVINGEYWGVYVNAQHFNKEMVHDRFATTQGARWKVPGSPRGRGGLTYLGEEVSAYRRIYEIKSKDGPKAWSALIQLCRVLTRTPSNELAQALEPLLDVDETLKFLALDNVFINNDGFWTRASDYSLYLDVRGRFHLVPHDANETFLEAEPPGPPGGPGPGGPPHFRRGARGAEVGVKLDPLVSANDEEKTLAFKLLSVPAWRARYLGYVREIATRWLDWERLGPIAQQYQNLIAADVQLDTRKLASTEDFFRSMTNDIAGGDDFGPPGHGHSTISLKHFVEQRRAYLLSLPIVGAKAASH